MDAEAVSKYSDLPLNEVMRLLNMSAQDIYKDSIYIEALEHLDKDTLLKNLPMVRDLYEQHLVEFKQEIHDAYGVNSDPMSGYTLGNWVVGILNYPNSANELLNFHKNVDASVFRGSAETLIEVLEDMPQDIHEWQKAFCLLSFPLMNS